ncbi:MAG: ParB family protein [Gammaproteobacteria bacterium]
MAKQRSEQDVIDLLNPPTYGATDNGRLPDPLCKAHIDVTIDQLMPYDGNPRQSRNPKYDEIKASIHQRGLDHPPKVTRRHPDDDKYMILDGGNTRLQILQELFEETGEERFSRLSVDFQPWVDEIDALAGHMVENEQRGDLLFVEKSLAAVRMRELIEEKTGEAISGRELAKQITQTGWTLSQTHLTRFEYATNRLLPSLPTAFWAGAGEPAVKRLRKLDTAYAQYWCKHSGDEEAFVALFDDVLAAHDDETLDYDGIQQALDIAVSEALDIDYQTVAVECDALSNGRSGDTRLSGHPEQQVTTDIDSGSDGTLGADDVPGVTTNAATNPPSSVSPVTDGQPAAVGKAQPPLSSPQRPAPAASQPKTPTSPPLAAAAKTSPAMPVPEGLASQQRRCYELAYQIAKPWDMHLKVLPITRFYGFVVDIPRPDDVMEYQHCLSDLYRTQVPIDPFMRTHIWNLLCGLSAQLRCTYIAEYVPQNSHIYELLQKLPPSDEPDKDGRPMPADGEDMKDIYNQYCRIIPIMMDLISAYAPPSVLDAMNELQTLQAAMWPEVRDQLLERYACLFDGSEVPIIHQSQKNRSS